MKTALLQLTEDRWITDSSVDLTETEKAQLVICFGSSQKLTDSDIYKKVSEKFPHAEVAMCSTAGEIFHNKVQDDSFIAVALRFDDTSIHTASVNIADFSNSFDAAVALVHKLSKEELTGILIFSDGSMVNGSELVKGLNSAADKNVLITGGLAGDGANFKSTLVGLNKQPAVGNIIAIGFYGDKIVMTHGSQGGWDSFGPEREVTKSEGNVLFEIDGKHALDLYKKYLGSDVDNLPGSALLFPLAVTLPGSSQAVSRTILSIDDDHSSMTFAGDIPEGAKVRFMKANFDKLTSAASTAAQNTIRPENGHSVFALLVSCVGRKLILSSRIDEEVEAVQETLGMNTLIAGFYSYGEISPFNDGGSCQLHNQTMTITSFYEHA
ncbi:MAG: FIST N-terminal domain-containing protein [Lacibacter sp.]